VHHYLGVNRRKIRVFPPIQLRKQANNTFYSQPCTGNMDAHRGA